MKRQFLKADMGIQVGDEFFKLKDTIHIVGLSTHDMLMECTGYISGWNYEKKLLAIQADGAYLMFDYTKLF